MTVKLSKKSLYMADIFIADIYYRGHFFAHRVSILGKIYVLIAETLWFVGKKENTCIILFDTFLYFNMKLMIKLYSSYFSAMLLLLHLHKK